MKRKIKLLKAFAGVDLSKRRIPLISLTSAKKGPAVWLCSAVHGDEVTGIEVIHRLFDIVEQRGLLKGKILAFPVMNPLGFEMMSRDSPYDEEDLNRQFPGDAKGITAERLAYAIFSNVTRSKPELVFDLHTDSMNSIAYTIVDKPSPLPDSSPVVKKSVEYAEKLGLVWAFDYEQHIGYPLEKSLTGSLMLRGIPALTLELGGPYVINETFVQKGLRAILNLLSCLKMVKSSRSGPVFEKKDLPGFPLKFIEDLKSESSGIVDYQVRPGDLVKKGTVLAKVKDATGRRVELIRSPQKALVVSHIDQSVCFPGSELFTLAVMDRTPLRK